MKPSFMWGVKCDRCTWEYSWSVKTHIEEQMRLHKMRGCVPGTGDK